MEVLPVAFGRVADGEQAARAIERLTETSQKKYFLRTAALSRWEGTSASGRQTVIQVAT